VHIFSRKNTNQELIEQLILENYNQYYRIAYSYVRNEADACDIVQNGAYRAIRGSHTLKKAAYAQTWVYRIMLNECFRFLRQPKHLSYEELQDEMGNEPFYTEDGSASLDLQRALDALPEQDKAVILLRYFEDMKLEEIAMILEENLSTVKSRLYRSMKKLRGALGEDEGGIT